MTVSSRILERITQVATTEAFVAWQAAIGQAINGWRRRQAEVLLDLIEQLVQEGEPFLSPGSQPYGQYLLWSARFLVQDLRWQEAQTVLNQATQVFEQGGKQVDHATALNNLAELYRSQGKYEQAEPLYQRALAIREKQLGAEHPDTATNLNNLALLYQTQGKYKQAESFYQRALAIVEKTLGPDHPNTMTFRANYTGLLEEMKRNKK